MGDIQAVHPEVLRVLLENRFVPVIASLGADEQGHVLDINADTIAAEIAGQLPAEKLFLFSNVVGVLKDVADPSSKLSYLTVEAAEEMIRTRKVSGGMVPKLNAAVIAVQKGVRRAHIINGIEEDALLYETFTPEGPGHHDPSEGRRGRIPQAGMKQDRRKILGARFGKGLGEPMQRLNASIAFDRRLYAEDVEGSLAWAEALVRLGLLGEEDAAKIRQGLEQILCEIREGRFGFREDLEDIHMNVESRLTELVGDAGKRLHTGRSRNDQVATDLRMYVRRVASEAAEGVRGLIGALVDLAEREFGVVIPAYTHLQRAQPVLLAHHLLAYAEMFLRDVDRFLWAADRADECPLGSGACAGNQFGVDRELLGSRLGFARLSRNSMDAVSDRDFACDFLHAATMFLVHISRLSEDVILWSSAEFALVTWTTPSLREAPCSPRRRTPTPASSAAGNAGASSAATSGSSRC